ncbi:hypothetical protein BDW22DRAFT_186717 [Trametopsis cervina]|nr:hypothetical protein BDW22DRAFT_186717 [Trametopsis cervina]
MAPQPFEFNLETMLNSLKYLSDTLHWLSSMDDNELFRVFQESTCDVLAAQLWPLVFAVKRMRNRYPVVNRLPSEILSAIFESLMPAYPKMTLGYRDYVNLDSIIENSGYRSAAAAPSLVCRHWRNVILGTPAMWTDVHVSSQTLAGDNNDPYGRFISRQLVRSGNRPLNVQFYEALSPASLQLTFMQDLLEQVYRIRRLALPLDSADDDIYPWTENANQLEVLDISGPYRPRHSGLLNLAQVPRLHTLGVSGGVPWQTGAFRNLRHLLLKFSHDTSLADFVKGGLMTVLALNAHTLEDIVISDPLVHLDVDDELETVLKAVSPVDMPALKRIDIEGTPAFNKIVEPRLMLHDCARDYHFDQYTFDSADQELSAGNHISANKLFISTAYVAGVKGAEAVRVRNNSPGTSLSLFFDRTHVEELWLWAGWDRDGVRPARELLKLMRAVKTLVIRGGEKKFLAQYANFDLFPSLSELQLHSQIESSYPALLKFFARRKQDGQAIETLRFVRDPQKSRRTGAYAMFKQRKSELELYVGNVVYDDLPDGREAPCMELPAVCNTKSLVHAFWDPWHLL